jgi:hypothetical protein
MSRCCQAKEKVRVWQGKFLFLGAIMLVGFLTLAIRLLVYASRAS